MEEVTQDNPIVQMVFTKLLESVKTVLHLTTAVPTLKLDLVQPGISAMILLVILDRTVCLILQVLNALPVLIVIDTMSFLQTALGKPCQLLSELSKSLIVQTASLVMFANLEIALLMTAPSATTAPQEETMESITKRCSSALEEPTTLYSEECTGMSARTVLQVTSVTKKARLTTQPMLALQVISASKDLLLLKPVLQEPTWKKKREKKKVTVFLASMVITAPKELQPPSSVPQVITVPETQCSRSHVKEVSTVTKTPSTRKKIALSISIAQEDHLKLRLNVTKSIRVGGTQKCRCFVQLVEKFKTSHNLEDKTNVTLALLDSTPQCKQKSAKSV